MLFILIASFLSLHYIQINNSIVPENDSIENIETNFTNTVPKTTKSKKSEVTGEIMSVEDENISENIDQTAEIEPDDPDLLNNDDLYEEIIFNDDFDKEYRSGTEDNYLDD